MRVTRMADTHGVKLIGSKRKLTDYIKNMIASECGQINTAIDVFTGTTRVAQALRSENISVTTSDLSWASEAYAQTFVHNGDNRHLAPLIAQLNNITPEADWLTKYYCDVLSSDGKGGIVKVWQERNGMKADAIRNHIETLSIEPWEKMTLITSLIFALDKVDNTVGLQQAYLKEWCTRSHNELVLTLPALIWNPDTEPTPVTGQHFVGDALKIQYPSADLAYLDPPYSPHSYSTYYHIWDSIVRWDKPGVDLKTNRREDRCARNDKYDNTNESAWNRKAQALKAFDDLILRLDTKYVLVSYSSDSLVPIQDLIALCETHGKVTVERIDYKRHIMCKIGMMGDDKDIIEKNQELLILIDRT